ncbi:alpha/beta hydrolase [Novosphingobium kaempferiae]|uniref:alpha/beta hydrolase n=1 Tax=Novosphingobium kaempferiae TaxID=2896849 RepID=UPI001E548E90|nr:alpha/beta hydrolase [Novosphingobium kaempferiae]
MIATSTVRLAASGGRAVDVTICAPLDLPDDPIGIVFSHGVNAAPSRYGVLLTRWARAGFVVCAPMHLDSEEHGARVIDDPSKVRRTRVEDFALVSATLSQGIVGLPPITRHAAVGHSYGALIAQVAGGALLDPATGTDPLPGPEPLCVVALSPPPPMPGVIDAAGWSRCTLPMLCVTGTADVMPGFVDDWRQHLVSCDAAPRGVPMVFEGMDHYFDGAFGRLRPGDAKRGEVVERLNAGVVGFIRACAGLSTP